MFGRVSFQHDSRITSVQRRQDLRRELLVGSCELEPLGGSRRRRETIIILLYLYGNCFMSSSGAV